MRRRRRLPPDVAGELAIVGVCYASAAVAVGVGLLIGERWPLLFAMLLAPIGAILHVAVALSYDGDEDE